VEQTPARTDRAVTAARMGVGTVEEEMVAAEVRSSGRTRLAGDGKPANFPCVGI